MTTVHRDLREAVAGADLVCVCAPIGELPAAIAEVLGAAPGATVTDIGSTKSAVVASVPPDDRARFVGGHPMCGREVRGAQHAVVDLFVGATWFLTPIADTDTRSLPRPRTRSSPRSAPSRSRSTRAPTTGCSRSRATCRT